MHHDNLDNLARTAITDEIQKLVVGAVIRYNGRYLVLRRVSTDFMGGLIELASGGVDLNESLSTALIREVKEETSLEIIEIKGYLSSFDYKSGSGKRARQFNFLVTVSGDTVKLNPQEHDWYAWIKIPSNDFDLLNISAHTRAVLLQAISKQYEEL